MWFVTLIYVVLARADGEPKLQFQVIPPKIQPGEHATLELRLPLAPGEESAEADLPQVHDELLEAQPKLQVLERDFKKTDKEWIWRYELTTYAMGTLRVPPIEVRRKGENYSSESVSLEVFTGRGEKDLALRPEFGALSRPFPWSVIGIGLLVFGIGYGALTWFRKYKDRLLKKLKLPEIKPLAPPPESPEVWLRRELQRIKERVASKDYRVIDELSTVWRGYFARRAQAPVEAWTSFEMLARLSEDARTLAIFPLWVECDHYKFAGQVMDPANLANRSLEESERILLNVAAS